MPPPSLSTSVHYVIAFSKHKNRTMYFDLKISYKKICIKFVRNCKCYYEEPCAGKPHARLCEGLAS